jgi:hypothetical protein
VSPGAVRAANAFRVLVETEFCSDGSWKPSGFSTARLPEALDHAAILQRLEQEGARTLSRRNGAGALPSLQDWEQFRDDARTAFAEELNRLIRRNWPAPNVPSIATVVVSIRTMLLDPDAKAQNPAIPWLKLIPFDAAAAKAAAKLRDDAVAVDCSGTCIGFASGGERIVATLMSPSEVLVEGCEVYSAPGSGNGRQIWKGSLTRVVRRNQQTALPLVSLSAEAVRSLASDNGEHSEGEFRIFLRGRSTPIAAPLPPAALPASGNVADLLIDFGSTTTKWALRFEGREGVVEHDQDTLTLTESWGVEAYRKADLITDATGERWCEWVARMLPAVRRWVGREHKAYLRHVYVSLPRTQHFDVNSLAVAIRDCARPSDVQPERGIKHLLRATAEHLVSSGRVVLVPEHELLADHYLSVLRVLQEAARDYQNRCADHAKKRQQQESARASFDETTEARRRYEAKNWLVRMWSRARGKAPEYPSGDRPTVDSEIAGPAEWMDDLIDHPEQLDHVVLLDAGGLSLDISVLEKHSLVAQLSHSDASCGGEAISVRIGRKEGGSIGTRYKALLGLNWDESLGLGPEQREYRSATRTLHERPLKSLFESLEARWTRRRCSVLLTGGGSRNPHFADYVVELACGAGLKATVLDARVVQDLIRRAREFPEPLAALDSPSITRFEEVQAWSERRERQARARYDKFAIVGGMCALEKGDG